MSKPLNYSESDWQVICQGKAIPPDMRVNESLPEYLERKVQAMIDERNELLGLLREAREIIEVISPYDSEATRRMDAALSKHGDKKC